MTKKINLGAALGALFMFFLPWVDFQCSGKSIMTQTGIQTITGGSTISDEMKALGAENQASGNEDKKHAPLVGLALLAVTGAGVVALAALRSDGGKNTAGVLCAIALGILVVQMIIGFPAERELEKAMTEQSESEAPDDPMAGMMAGAMMPSLSAKYLMAFYLELVFLALPTLLVFNGVLERMKKNRPGAET